MSLQKHTTIVIFSAVFLTFTVVNAAKIKQDFGLVTLNKQIKKLLKRNQAGKVDKTLKLASPICTPL